MTTRVNMSMCFSDIHKAADKIGEISGLSLGHIRMELLDKWLPPIHQEDADIVSTSFLSLSVIASSSC